MQKDGRRHYPEVRKGSRSFPPIQWKSQGYQDTVSSSDMRLYPSMS